MWEVVVTTVAVATLAATIAVLSHQVIRPQLILVAVFLLPLLIYIREVRNSTQDFSILRSPGFNSRFLSEAKGSSFPILFFVIQNEAKSIVAHKKHTKLHKPLTLK